MSLTLLLQEEWRRWLLASKQDVVAQRDARPYASAIFKSALKNSAAAGAPTLVSLADLLPPSHRAPVALDVLQLMRTAQRASRKRARTTLPAPAGSVAMADASVRRRTVDQVAIVLGLGPRETANLQAMVEAALANSVHGTDELGGRAQRKRHNTDPELRDRLLGDLERSNAGRGPLPRDRATLLATQHGVSLSYVYKLAGALRRRHGQHRGGAAGSSTLDGSQARIASSMAFLFGSRAKWLDFVYALKALIIFEETHRTLTAVDVVAALRNLMAGRESPSILTDNAHYRSEVLPVLRARLHEMSRRCGRGPEAISEALVYRAWSHDGTSDFRDDQQLREKGRRYLQELERDDKLDIPGVKKEVLAAMPLSFKGAQKVYAESAREDARHAQRVFVQRMAQGMWKGLLFVDESSLQLSSTRRSGWGLQGLPTLVCEPFSGGRDVKIWAAIRDPEGIRAAPPTNGNGRWLCSSPAFVLALPAPESNSPLQHLLPKGREAQQAVVRDKALFSLAVAALRQDDRFLPPWPTLASRPWPAGDESLAGALMHHLHGLPLEDRRAFLRGVMDRRDATDVPPKLSSAALALAQVHPYKTQDLAHHGRCGRPSPRTPLAKQPVRALQHTRVLQISGQRTAAAAGPGGHHGRRATERLQARHGRH